MSAVPTDRVRISTRRRTIAIAAAAVLFAAVFALRLLAGDGTATPVLLLALVPVTLLAVELGVAAGLAGSLIALGMLTAWVIVDDVSLSAFDWAWRVAAFVALTIAAAALATIARDRITAGWRSRERLMEVIATTHEGFVSMDAAGVITAWNPEAEAIFGWSAEQAIGGDRRRHDRPGAAARRPTAAACADSSPAARARSSTAASSWSLRTATGTSFRSRS